MKRKVTVLIILMIAIVSAVFLFPIKLTGMIPTETDINILWLEGRAELSDGGHAASPANESRSYTIKLGTHEHEALKEILDSYYCHLTLRTIFGNSDSVECSSDVLYITSGSSHNMITGKAQARFGERIYRIGYFGNARAEALTEEICKLLEGLEPNSDT